jgi:hypothetical protein
MNCAFSAEVLRRVNPWGAAPGLDTNTRAFVAKDGHDPATDLQSKHILHGIKPGWFSDEPLRCPQRASRKNFAAGRAMGQFQTLARAGKEHCVISDHLAFPD